MERNFLGEIHGESILNNSPFPPDIMQRVFTPKLWIERFGENFNVTLVLVQALQMEQDASGGGGAAIAEEVLQIMETILQEATRSPESSKPVTEGDQSQLDMLLDKIQTPFVVREIAKSIIFWLFKFWLFCSCATLCRRYIRDLQQSVRRRRQGKHKTIGLYNTCVWECSRFTTWTPSSLYNAKRKLSGFLENVNVANKLPCH